MKGWARGLSFTSLHCSHGHTCRLQALFHHPKASPEGLVCNGGRPILCDSRGTDACMHLFMRQGKPEEPCTRACAAGPFSFCHGPPHRLLLLACARWSAGAGRGCLLQPLPQPGLPWLPGTSATCRSTTSPTLWTNIPFLIDELIDGLEGWAMRSTSYHDVPSANDLIMLSQFRTSDHLFHSTAGKAIHHSAWHSL